MISAQVKQNQQCAQTCHGANGVSVAPIYPNLNGQKESYLVGSLKAYKAGQRKGGMSAIMVPQAMNLSDVDMEDLATFYASLK
ncbi:c-type cytochrome [Psychromonas sp. KJ10-10]|uniref:c-type cytochrome n=1 Tax=Psychromonas sp. KJ10-10 TaxID=3391823 RepID=UPI0039B4ABEB